MEIRQAREDLIRGCYEKLTVCETLRRIYDLIVDMPDKKLQEQITDRLLEAIVMTRKMSNRLIYYKTTYKDTTGHNSSNLKDNPDYGKVREMRQRRTI